MNILFIDDSDDRHQQFERAMSETNFDTLHAFNYQEAVELLKAKHIQIGVVLFDHDLGEGKSGSDVASFVLDDLDSARFPTQAVVHSMNPEGAKNIASKLTTAGIITFIDPFSTEMIKRLIDRLQPQ